MPNPNGKLNLSQIQNELQQIIIHVKGGDLHSIPDDIPILDLGVGSLALVEGMRQVFDRFGVLVSIRRVIEGQITIGTLALYIEQELNSQQSLKKKLKDSQWQVERQIQLAPSQQHLGFLSRYSSEAASAFNEALVLRLKGTLHGPALHAAIEEAGNRYESLRTALDAEQNALDIGTGQPLELNASPVSADELDIRLAEIVTNPFEVGRRLFRAELLRISDTEHVLALVGHSLVIEQRALKNILNHIAELYRVFSHDQAAGSPPLALQWTDYLALSKTDEAKEAHRLAEYYWEDVFASGLPRLELPADHPRPPIKKYYGSRADLRLDSVTCKRLLAFADSEGVRPEAVIFAAFTTFVHRLSDLGDIVVGVESESLYLDNNNVPAIANTHNMLPLRMSFDAARSFKEHVQQQGKALEAANKNRHISLGELIQVLQISRDQSRSPLFTTAYRSQKEESAPIFDGLESEFILPPSAGARYDIELIAVFEGKTGIQLVCEYSTELFERETVSRWLNGIAALLDSGLQDSSQSCGLLPVMSSREQQMILTEWNKTEKEYAREKTVLDLIAEQARAGKEAKAIQFGDSALNYSQLMERVEQIASALHQRGVKHGDRVGILMKRSLDLIPAILAAWRLGALYVPMDIGFPKQRIAYMLEDSKAHTVITNKELSNLLGDEFSSVALFVEDVNETNLEETAPANGADSAYIMYTSGSTGKPKGVEIRHSALVNCLLAVRDYLEFTPGSRMLALTTTSFDISTAEILMPLMSGGCVDLGEDGLVADGLSLMERLEGRKPSHVQATPSTWKAVLAAGWMGNNEMCVFSAGEALSRDLAEALLLKCRAVWNLYGPTETTVYSSAYRVESAPEEPIRIGRPLPNTQMYILDKKYQPVPIGAVGDLYIAGDGLAVGYWQRPELTDERFVANPFAEGKRMYWTGDLARYLPDGNIVCLGRLDDQVKIHGVRVELGEVESALRGIEGVRDAVVVSWKDSRGDLQLVGHVIPNGKNALTAPQIRSQLRERLPEAMIPPYILFAASFPQTANGKVHRAGLPAPDGVAQIPAEKKIEPPATVTEQKVAKTWAGLLGIDLKHIGRESDFMELGGHSLLMTVLMVEVRKLFQVSFKLREFFDASTLEKFSALIDERQKLELDKSNDAGRSASMRSPEWARQRMAFLQREAELPRYLAPARGLIYKPAKEIQNVLLTGATGFLGAYIVAEILATTRAHIYCLVRPKRGEDSKERIEKQMKRYQVWAGDEAWLSAWEHRLHVVDGDVTLPRLGMKDSDYETLARDVDAIFHGAAHVNFIYPYEALRATNVLGIHEVIQFAFYARIKAVHHLSTAAIWPMGAQYTFYEKDPIDHYGLLNLGYDEAKWVGEKCLLHAEERGLPVARYRPGEVGGDSVTGRCVTDHFIIACFKGFLQFGAFPDMDIEVDVAPVDYVAQAMVHLAFHRNATGRAFHLTNPTRRRLKDGLGYLRNLGYQFDEVPFVNLRDRLVTSPGFANNALFAYQAALDEMDNVSMQLPTYDTRETDRELADSGISCPPADEKLFGTYLRYLQDVGFIPQPEELTAALS
ncbi:MAG: amino acid adenylation domain-containing protein [Chloroflexi bacterium]|nr:amino acid adenylation domain-containing protein [Chloroflexota bacterium]